MSRALVLGGGGPVGIGWEAGLAVGLAGAGVTLRDADMILGTSAGAAVGALLALDLDVVDALVRVADAAGEAFTAGDAPRLLEVVASAMTSSSSPEEARRTLGRFAVESTRADEDAYVALFSPVGGRAWPEGYVCTAVDVETGELALWDRAAGAPLDRAVASSCAVPGVFPPVTIAGRRYMDGGTRTILNADLVADHDRVVAVSCFPRRLPEGLDDPAFSAMAGQLEAELARLRRRGADVELIVPGEEFLELSSWGLDLMDYGRAADAFVVGARQAEAEAERIAGVWHA